MKLDTLSKQCLIAAAVALLLCINCILLEAQVLWLIFDFKSEDITYDVIFCFLKILVYLAAAVISILKIVGIKKRRAILVVPWLLAAICGVAYFSYDVVLNLTATYNSHFEFLLYPIQVFGVSFVILYPLLTVLGDIRRETAQGSKQQDQKIMDFIKM